MSKRDKYSKIEDLLNDKSFLLWILENVDSETWENWTLESPKRAKLVADARVFLIASKPQETKISKGEVQEELYKTWTKIKLGQEKNKRGNWYKYAAAVIIVSLVSFVVFKNSSVTLSNSKLGNNHYESLVNNEIDGLIEQVNNSKTAQIISLSDGSSVLLQPKSKLSYPPKFDAENRTVILSGEAFFEIKKDASKPFLVYANELVTRVLGTSFKIKAYSNDTDTEVVVRTGKVSVSENGKSWGSNEIELLPNQAARFNRHKSTLEKIENIIEEKSIVAEIKSIEKLSFDFEDVPVSQIFKTLEQAYSIEIQFPESKLKECFLTTSLNDQPLSEKLNIICESLGNNTRYAFNNNKIIIKSEGCN